MNTSTTSQAFQTPSQAQLAQAPLNFGLEFLTSPSHHNLTLVVQQGEPLQANSVVLSLNSPVISHVTGKLGQRQYSLRGFSRSTVQRFLEAAYTGSLEEVTKKNFRDINNLVTHLEVPWMIDRCFSHFKTWTFGMDANNFAEQHYVFTEALYIYNHHNKRNYVDIVVKGFSAALSVTRFFVTNYLESVSLSCPLTALDILFEIAENKEFVILEAIVQHIDTCHTSISQNGRYLLERICETDRLRFTHRALYKSLMEKLEGAEDSMGDFMLVFKLKQISQKPSKIEDSIPYADIPNLFYDYECLKSIGDIDGLMKYLVGSEKVTNCYTFYDAVAIWLNQRGYSSYAQFIPDGFVERFAEHKTSQGWQPLSLHYIGSNTANSFNKKIFENMHPSLITYSRYFRIESVSWYTPEELFGRDHDIMFKFREEAVTECTQEGICGFLLRITGATKDKENKFNIRLLTDGKYYKGDLHFHDESLSMIDGIHFALDVTENVGPNKNASHATVKWETLKVTWYGKPHRDATGDYWCWGPHRFHKKGKGQLKSGNRYKRGQFFGDPKTTRIRPVIYYFRY